MQVCYLFISKSHNYFGHHGQLADAFPVLAQARINCRAGRGIEGDRFFNYKENYKGQITFFECEVFEDICQMYQLSGKTAGVVRRNVLTRGVDLNDFIGIEFSVQGVHFFWVEECRPCYWMNEAIAPGAENALRGRGGLRARILSDGILSVEP